MPNSSSTPLKLEEIAISNAKKAVHNLVQKIKFCDNSAKKFHPSQKDLIYIKRYKVEYFRALALISINNTHRCSISEELHSYNTYKKTYYALKQLSIFPDHQKKFKWLGSFKPEGEKELFGKLALVDPELLIYLKKRVTNKRFNFSQIATLLEKARKNTR